MSSVAQDLATAVGGTVRAESLIIITAGDTVHVLDCRPTGRVMLDGRFQLGSIGDGVEHLASMYYAATSEVTC